MKFAALCLLASTGCATSNRASMTLSDARSFECTGYDAVGSRHRVRIHTGSDGRAQAVLLNDMGEMNSKQIWPIERVSFTKQFTKYQGTNSQNAELTLSMLDQSQVQGSNGQLSFVAIYRETNEVVREVVRDLLVTCRAKSAMVL